MKQSVRILALVAGTALVASAAHADGYWPQAAARARGPLPWTGLYMGLNAGYGWHDVGGVFDNVINPTDLSGTNPNGAILGGQIGYNLRMNWFLMGVELDADTGASSSSVVDTFNGAHIEGSVSYLLSARGRLGVLWNDVLLFGTIGVGGVRYSFQETLGALGATQELTDTAAVYGGGLEWMVAYGVSLRAEYLRYDLGGNASLSPGFFGGSPGDFVQIGNVDVVRGAVNVRLAP